jgi:flagellar export protein FliJ
MTAPEYPLERVMDIKKKRVTEAEKVVAQKEQALEKEREKLRKCEEERDKVLQHKKDKLNQLRDELDGGTTTDKIQQMKNYIKVVDERIVVEEKKVKDQLEQVNVAKRNLEIAEEDLRMRRLEVDKLKTHKEDWQKQMRREMELQEEKEMDEIGQVLYLLNLRKGA